MEMSKLQKISERVFIEVVKIVISQIEGDDVWQQVKKQRVDVSQTATSTPQSSQEADVAEYFGLQVLQQGVVTQLQFLQSMETVEEAGHEFRKTVASQREPLQGRKVSECRRRNGIYDVAVQPQIFQGDETAKIRLHKS
jgi:hypothetical protein